MKTVNVITEGQSERDFVNMVLRPHTRPLGLTLNPVVVVTGSKHGRQHQGGTVKFEVLKPQLEEFIQIQSALTTTMFDYVRLHKKLLRAPGTAGQCGHACGRRHRSGNGSCLKLSFELRALYYEA